MLSVSAADKTWFFFSVVVVKPNKLNYLTDDDLEDLIDKLGNLKELTFDNVAAGEFSDTNRVSRRDQLLHSLGILLTLR
jgi:hypothetical protein